MLDFEQTADELSKLGEDAVGRIAKLVKMQLALEARLQKLEEEQEEVASEDKQTKSVFPGVIERFKPFWHQLDSKERVTLFVWINEQMKAD